MSGNPSSWKGENLILRLERDNLVLHEGHVSELEFPLQIGRKNGCTWVTPDDDLSVSGIHAEIYTKRRELHIRDMGSRNGMFVMGAREKDIRLKDGVKVGIGRCLLVVEKDHQSSRSSQLRHHRLEQLNGNGAGKFFEIKAATTPIGSDVPPEGIACPSFLVSRRHAELIRKADDSCWIKDLGSRNGTRVNHKPLKRDTERLLRHGDIISFAEIEYKFWDRNGPPPNPWKMKVAIALVTAALCGTGYFIFDALCPSAKAYLAEAARCEWNEQFAAAKNLLDQAATARNYDSYREEISRMKANLAIWVKTTNMWHQVQVACPNRKWINASKFLGTLLSDNPDRWGWNTTTAQKEKRRARILRELLDVFMVARGKLEGRFATDEVDRESTVLEDHLQRMERALKRSDWADDIPSGELRGDMAEQRDAMKAVIGDLQNLEMLIQRIPRPGRGAQLKEVFALTDDFEMRIRKLEQLKASVVERDKQRAEAAKKAKRRFVKSDLVLKKSEQYEPALRKFIETRNALLANCRALVQCRYDAIKRDIPLPSDRECSLLPAFGDLYVAFKNANEMLHDTYQKTIKSQVDRLVRLQVGGEKPPACFAALLDTAAMKSAFSCDTLDPASQPISRQRTERKGLFDKILGVEEFGGSFLSGFERSSLLETHDSERPEPLLVQTMRLCLQLEMFRKFSENADIAYLLSLDVQGGNKLHDLSVAALDLLEKRGLLVDTWWNQENGDMRAKLVAHAAAWALDGGRLDEDDKQELDKEYQTWRNRIMQLDKRIRSHPEEVSQLRPQILSLCIPGNSSGNINRHWADEAKQRGAP